MKRAFALFFTLAGCNFAPLDGKTLYRCEPDGTCVQKDHRCLEDLLCHPWGDGTGGGAGGGGAGDGGTGGGAGGGGTGGGVGGGDAGCQPNVCGARQCGQVDNGCGASMICPACSGDDFCGGGGPNVCGQQVCTDNGWCWESPYPQGNSLRGAWAAAPNDVWAVGDVGTVLRFNGKVWSPVTSGTRNNLRAIAGLNANDLWIVGDSSTVLHWDGTSLKPEAVTFFSDLQAVVAASGGVVWVAGTNATIAMRSGAGAWSTFASASTNATFRALWSFGPNDVWAAGTDVQRFTGTKFNLVATGVPTQYQFHSLWSPAQGQLVGVGTGGVLASFDGGSWVYSFPLISGTQRAIFGNSTDDLWVVGDRGVWHVGDGGLVNIVPFAFNYNAGLSLDGGEALAVGNSGIWASIQPDAGSRSTYLGTSGIDMNDVFAVNASTVIAVGNLSGWYERFPNLGLPSWVRRSCSFSQPLQSLWVSPTGWAYASASSNLSINFRLGTSTCVSGFGNTTYAGLWGFPAGPLHWAGDRFTDVTYDGGLPPNLIELRNPASSSGGTSWNGVWGSTPQEMFTVGTDGGLLTLVDYDAGWAPVASPALGVDLLSVYGVGSASTLDVWAVGQRGTVLRRQGAGAFATVDAGGGLGDLRDVWVGGPDNVWVIGPDAGAMKFDGQRWTTYQAPVRSLRRIHGAQDAGVWAIGSSNSILFHP